MVLKENRIMYVDKSSKMPYYRQRMVDFYGSVSVKLNPESDRKRRRSEGAGTQQNKYQKERRESSQSDKNSLTSLRSCV